MKYETKPARIKAWQYVPGEKIPKWVQKVILGVHKTKDKSEILIINIREIWVAECHPGHWVVAGPIHYDLHKVYSNENFRAKFQEVK